MKNSSVELLRRTGCARCEESPAAIVKNAPLVRALRVEGSCKLAELAVKNSSCERLRRTGCARCEESPAAIVKNAPRVRGVERGVVAFFFTAV